MRHVLHTFGRASFARCKTLEGRLVRPSLTPLLQTSAQRSYTYKPLREDDIRVLDLLPGYDDEPVRCDLRNVALGQTPPYESLSYCWGLKHADQLIQCDGEILPVTRNLFEALHHLRRKGTARTLWIDAICIDQSNAIERGQQVGVMKDIFYRSQQTVVWLGTEKQDSSLAIDLIHRLAKASLNHASGSWGPQAAASLPPLYDSAWVALATLLQRPWWHRAWIVQEVSVTRNIVFLCGNETFTWHDLERAVYYAVDLGFFVAYGGSATYQAFSLFCTRVSYQGKQLPNLHDVLLQHRLFLATDPRDKVFGLLSLANQHNVTTLGVKPDYLQNSRDLFGKISEKLLVSNNLDGLKGAGIHDKSEASNIPSWVADWSVSDPSVPLNTSVTVDHSETTTQDTPSVPHFDACRSTISNPVVSPDHQLLRLEGIIIDKIVAKGVLSRTRYLRHVSHMFELFVQCHDILTQLKDWEDIAQTRSHIPYPTGEHTRDAYWHTLCAGRVASNVKTARQDPRYKYYVLLRSLRRFVRLTVRWFPRSSADTWYNRFFYRLFQTAWRILGLTPTKVQRIGFPPESRLPNYRRMVRTKKGYIALAPRLAREGDYVVVCKGGEMPLVVRRDGEYWVLLGESYVHGIMYGEAWDEEKCVEMWFK